MRSLSRAHQLGCSRLSVPLSPMRCGPTMRPTTAASNAAAGTTCFASACTACLHIGLTMSHTTLTMAVLLAVASMTLRQTTSSDHVAVPASVPQP